MGHSGWTKNQSSTVFTSWHFTTHLKNSSQLQNGPLLVINKVLIPKSKGKSPQTYQEHLHELWSSAKNGHTFNDPRLNLDTYSTWICDSSMLGKRYKILPQTVVNHGNDLPWDRIHKNVTKKTQEINTPYHPCVVNLPTFGRLLWWI